MVVGGLVDQYWLVVVLLMLLLSYYVIILWLLPWMKLWFSKMTIFPVHTIERNLNLLNPNWGTKY